MKTNIILMLNDHRRYSATAAWQVKIIDKVTAPSLSRIFISYV